MKKKTTRRATPKAGQKLKRYCFVLRVKPAKMAEYKRRHQRVWPAQIAALRDAGWTNFSIYLRDDGLLVGYVETASFKRALRDLDKAEVNAKWQKEMAEFFESERRPDQAMTPLEEVFHLD